MKDIDRALIVIAVIVLAYSNLYQKTSWEKCAGYAYDTVKLRYENLSNVTPKQKNMLKREYVLNNCK
jgi:hypothetical protein